MQYLPICLKLHGAPVLLVGAGTVATRKARLLLRAGADVTAVAPEACAELQALLQEHGGHWRQGCYDTADLEGKTLVVAATPVAEVNYRVYEDACALGVPVNVVDAPAYCNFIFPSIVDRDPLVVAISSSGSSPVLARQLRHRIDAMLPAALGRLAAFAGGLRDRVKQAIPDESARRLFWEKLLQGAVAEQVLAGNEARAEALFDEAIASGAKQSQGEVYLIGAGPGDPDLMTFKAARLLQSADVVLYDRLVSTPIVDMARRDAQRIYVGKRRGDHAVPQGQINQQLLDLAREGKRVVRLKGGDPFVFGRGGEEIELLARHGVPFQVVPGITAANAAACYAGIPLTHRDYAQSVRFVAGHLKDNSSNLDWGGMQSESETLVFYMGLVGLPVICEQLRAHGRRPDTPMALVERATREEQRVLTGTLATMVDIVASENPQAPTLIIVGDVVTLHPQLRWYGE
ncbi:uroporphyrinogen-III C-methyltransferase [Pseudohalioglobus sediminis]|uniref:Siroheme synthase n=1 Tax=Pseudohalioglobus sediminis TaxID=2606449 RepID=A0A5B0X3F9_9GAMM|nr:siroheme synthase CysG [Pseudohalioglobus sediminis]KAA1193077.1 uroporphyrinogen-III C-methyltransferase [Pseudohalioglobus sediminis]